MCLPSLVTDTMRRFLRLESSKKLQGKTAGGVVTTPPPGRPRVNIKINIPLAPYAILFGSRQLILLHYYCFIHFFFFVSIICQRNGSLI